MKYFGYLIIAVVILAVVGGFFIVGSPQNGRLQRFDDQKISDLTLIQNQIINFWQSKGKLPVALADLTDSVSGFQVPLDPQTGAAYGYSVKTANQFQLCAVFNRPSLNQQTGRTKALYPVGLGGNSYQNWAHAGGQVCFDRTIDKDLYPLKPQTSPPGSVPAPTPK